MAPDCPTSVTQVNSKRIAKNTLMLYGRMAISMMVSLYTSRVILEALGFTDFGIYNVVGGIVATLSALSSALSGATSRYITIGLVNLTKEKLRETFSTSFVLHLGLSVLIIALCETVGLWFLNCKLDIPSDRMYAANCIFQFSILSAALTLTQIPYNATMIAHEHMSIFAYVGLFNSFANLIVAFIIKSATHDRLILYAFCILIVNFCCIILSRAYCVKHFEECKLMVSKNKSLYKEMLSYTGFSLWINLAWTAQNQGISFILNIFFGPVLNAAQAIGNRIYGMLEQLYRGFGTAIQPTIFRLYANNETAPMLNIVERGARMSYMLVLLAVMPILLNTDYILSLWLGRFPDYTASIVSLIMISELFAVIGNTRLMLFHASKHIKEYSIYNGFVLLSSLPISYLLFKQGFSPTYAFITLLAAAITSDLTSLWLIGRFIDGFNRRKFFLKVECLCLGYSSVIFLPLSYLRNYITNDMTYLLVSTAISTLLIVFFLWQCVLTKSQKSKILSKVSFLK